MAPDLINRFVPGKGINATEEEQKAMDEAAEKKETF